MDNYRSPIMKAIDFLNRWDYAPHRVEIKFTSNGFMDANIDLGLNFEMKVHVSSSDDLDQFFTCLQTMYEKEGMANK